MICCDGTVDPTNPKTVRASAGSIFHLPVVSGGDAGTVVDALRRWEFTTVGTAVRDGVDYAAFDWRRRVALVFGNEASGLDESLMSRLDARVSVPMDGRGRVAERERVGGGAVLRGPPPTTPGRPQRWPRTANHGIRRRALYDLGHGHGAGGPRGADRIGNRP